jgi:tRNA modification GTPase
LGVFLQVLDTAGIRETEDVVEKIGVERSRQAAQSADLVLMVIDASVGWIEKDTEIYNIVSDRPLILVINKIDVALASKIHLPQENGRRCKSFPIVKTTASQNIGIEDLEATILKCIQQDAIMAANLDVAINQRQKACLLRVVQSLDNVKMAITDQLPLDFWTIDLRSAISAIGEITGEEVTESVLDQIFSRFCIGK